MPSRRNAGICGKLRSGRFAVLFSVQHAILARGKARQRAEHGVWGMAKLARASRNRGGAEFAARSPGRFGGAQQPGHRRRIDPPGQ